MTTGLARPCLGCGHAVRNASRCPSCIVPKASTAARGYGSDWLTGASFGSWTPHDPPPQARVPTAPEAQRPPPLVAGRRPRTLVSMRDISVPRPTEGE